MPRPIPRNLWIIDGHNVIHATAPLEQLQHTDRRREARDRLGDACRRLAMRRGMRVLLCFDGIDLPGQPGVESNLHLEVTYSPEGIPADDIILHRASEAREQGSRVTVVSDDARMLRLLPREVQRLSVRGLWRACAGARGEGGDSGGRAGGSDEGKPTGTDRDIWETFLAAEPELRETLREVPASRRASRQEAPGMRHRRSAAEGNHVPSPSPSPPSSRGDDPGGPGFTVADRVREQTVGRPQDPLTPEPISPEERLKIKKERGRRKQARRLTRTGSPKKGKRPRR